MAEATKIYVYAQFSRAWDGYLGTALAEDGRVVATHLSSSLEWVRHDMGLTSTWKHEHYQLDFPNGYELIDLTALDDDGLDAHAEFTDAFALNQQRRVEV